MANISVECPRCSNSYLVEPGLRGRRMRCPNALCRHVFQVPGEADQPPPRPDVEGVERQETTTQTSGNVSDMVQVLDAEVAPTESKSPESKSNDAPSVPAAPDKPSIGESGKEAVEERIQERPPAPKPKIEDASSSSEPSSSEESSEADDDWLFAGPLPEAQATSTPVQEVKAGNWQAPPVRQATAATPVSTRVRTEAAGHRSNDKPAKAKAKLSAAKKAKRRSRLIIAVLLCLLVGGVASGIWLAQRTRAESEVERFAKAQKLYERQDFAQAAARLRELHRKFPDSEKRTEYSFLAELSDVREPIYNPSGDEAQIAQTLSRLIQFVEIHSDDNSLDEHEGELWHSFYKLTRELADWAEQREDRRFLGLAQRAREYMGKLNAPKDFDVEEANDTIDATFARLSKTFAERDRRIALLERFGQLARHTSATTLQTAQRLARKENLTNDPQVAPLLEKMLAEHLASIRYTAAKNKKRAHSDQEDAPSLALTPSTKRIEHACEQSRTIFALARGVLYAMSAKDGTMRWARRIGVDTNEIPLRLPADDILPERVLVVSSDRQTISALEVETGHPLWQCPLDAPSLGRPVLLKDRMFVPTNAGRVYEVEIFGGKILGHYDLGQPLTVGGAHQPGTNLLYFPASGFAVYVLDVVEKKCVKILYSKHASGSMRSNPVVFANPALAASEASRPGVPAGFLVLSQADGIDAVKLRVFNLPLESDEPSVEFRLPGWSWFPPYQDGEKLAQVTDAGIFARFYIRQKGNGEDAFLFPASANHAHVGVNTHRRERAQVTYVDAQNYWVTVFGRLHRLQHVFTRMTGPQLLNRWPSPPKLGSPLHRPEVHVDKSGKKTFFLVTQQSGEPTCLVSAVAAETGHIYWQRQLGVVSSEPPKPIGQKIVLHDNDELFLLPAKLSKSEGAFSQSPPLRRVPLPAAGVRHMLTRQVGKSVQALLVRHESLVFVSKEEDSSDEPEIKKYKLDDALAGVPAWDRDYVVLPLKNGVLERLSLKTGKTSLGPDWRAERLDASVRCFVVRLGDDTYLVTNGGLGINVVDWNAGKVSMEDIELDSRIVSKPVVLPSKGSTIRVVAAQAGGNLTLLEGERLRRGQSWSLEGKITAGPYSYGEHVACVVDGTRLVWIDPSKAKPVWEYTFVAEVVGRPLVWKKTLVVGTLSGQYLGVDVASGAPRGQGYLMRANVAPAAAPLRLDDGRLFCPLTDGTVMLLPTTYFEPEGTGE